MPNLLSDVRVLDLSDEPLAFGARLLADFGADVIRVEHMAVDALRRRGPHLDSDPPSLKWERGLAHLTYNAGKRSLAVDPRDRSLWDDLEPILAAIDVVFAPCEPNPALADWLDKGRRGEWAHETSLIDCTLRRGGPAEPISDISARAAGGHIVLNGHSEDPPIHPAGNLAYKQVSLAAAQAAISLVLQGGTGHIEIGMQEAFAFTALQTANGNYWPWHSNSHGRARELDLAADLRVRYGLEEAALAQVRVPRDLRRRVDRQHQQAVALAFGAELVQRQLGAEPLDPGADALAVVLAAPALVAVFLPA